MKYDHLIPKAALLWTALALGGTTLWVVHKTRLSEAPSAPAENCRLSRVGSFEWTACKGYGAEYSPEALDHNHKVQTELLVKAKASGTFSGWCEMEFTQGSVAWQVCDEAMLDEANKQFAAGGHMGRGGVL